MNGEQSTERWAELLSEQGDLKKSLVQTIAGTTLCYQPTEQDVCDFGRLLYQCSAPGQTPEIATAQAHKFLTALSAYHTTGSARDCAAAQAAQEQLHAAFLPLQDRIKYWQRLKEEIADLEQKASDARQREGDPAERFRKNTELIGKLSAERKQTREKICANSLYKKAEKAGRALPARIHPDQRILDTLSAGGIYKELSGVEQQLEAARKQFADYATKYPAVLGGKEPSTLAELAGSVINGALSVFGKGKPGVLPSPGDAHYEGCFFHRWLKKQNSRLYAASRVFWSDRDEDIAICEDYLALKPLVKNLGDSVQRIYHAEKQRETIKAALAQAIRLDRRIWEAKTSLANRVQDANAKYEEGFFQREYARIAREEEEARKGTEKARVERLESEIEQLRYASMRRPEPNQVTVTVPIQVIGGPQGGGMSVQTATACLSADDEMNLLDRLLTSPGCPLDRSQKSSFRRQLPEQTGRQAAIQALKAKGVEWPPKNAQEILSRVM